MSAKRRKYNEDYIKYGFVSIDKGDRPHPMCVICFKVLSNDAMRPCRLERHLLTKHSDLRCQPKEFFEAKAAPFKRIKIEQQQQPTEVIIAVTGNAGSFAFGPEVLELEYSGFGSEKELQASYELSLLIAKEKENHKIGERLLRPSILKAVEIILDTESKQKISQMKLSDNIIKKNIDDMAEDIKNQVVTAVDQSPFFALQLSESSDAEGCAQLIVYVRYIQDLKIKDELLFSKELTKATEAVEVVSYLSDFFANHDLSWEKLIGICTDGASAVLGASSLFLQLVKEKNPKVTVIHCFMHRQALAAKSLPSGIQEVLNLCITIINYIKRSAPNTRLFDALFEDLGDDNKILLFHTENRWLSKGNLLARLFELREQVILFLRQDNQEGLCAHFGKPGVQIFLAYLSDIFDSLNHLSLKLLAGDSNTIHHCDTIKAYVDKLQLWNRKISTEPCNYSSFPRLHAMSEETQLKEVFEDVVIKTQISHHLKHLSEEFQRYIPNPYDDAIFRLATDPFHIEIESLPENLQEQACEMKHNSSAKYDIEKTSKTLFWIKYLSVYPEISEVSLRLFLPFSNNYLCEKAFLAAVDIKTKRENQTDISSDLRCFITSITPRISNLVKNTHVYCPY